MGVFDFISTGQDVVNFVQGIINFVVQIGSTIIDILLLIPDFIYLLFQIVSFILVNLPILLILGEMFILGYAILGHNMMECLRRFWQGNMTYLRTIYFVVSSTFKFALQIASTVANYIPFT